MTTLTNYINSTAKASLNGRNPFKLAQLLNACGIYFFQEKNIKPE